MDVEWILDHVTHLLNDKEHPADDRHRRDHLPAQAGDEDEGKGEAPDAEEATGMTTVLPRHCRPDNPLAHSHDVRKVSHTKLEERTLRHDVGLASGDLNGSHLLLGLSVPLGHVVGIGIIALDNSTHHLDQAERPVPSLPEDFHVGLGKHVGEGRLLEVTEEGLPVSSVQSLKVLKQKGWEDRHQGQVVLPLRSGEGSVTHPRGLTDLVDEVTPDLTGLPETIVG
mmetsp:Transcript_753/g.1203  ORF Transcript_753/g.1203 Transcript_753/m.1203 type:complete len:225 (+) Transcript_753:249-923(+)